MKKEIEDFSYKIWNEEARKQIENELNFMSKEKIELPKDLDYLEIYSATHKTSEQIIEQKNKEIDKLNNIINELEKYINDTENWYIDIVHSYIDKKPFIMVEKLSDRLKELKENK